MGGGKIIDPKIEVKVPSIPEVKALEIPGGMNQPLVMRNGEITAAVGGGYVLNAPGMEIGKLVMNEAGKVFQVVDEKGTLQEFSFLSNDNGGLVIHEDGMGAAQSGEFLIPKNVSVAPTPPPPQSHAGKVMGGFRNYVQGFVEDGGYNIQAAFDPATGAVEFLATDLTTGNKAAVGRLYQGADGQTVFVGAYDKPIRNFFKFNGIQEPNAFLVPGRLAAELFMPDDIVIAELQKYFGEVFGPTKKYTPRTYYVEGGEHQANFQASVARFFGEGIMGSNRWAPNGPYSNILGKYEVVPFGGIPLQNGGHLYFNGTVKTPEGNYVLPASKTETAYTELNLPKQLSDGAVFTMETPGLSAPGNASARPTHKILHFYDPVKKNTVAVSVDLARSVYKNVDVFAISHHHADHFNPELVRKQIEFNSGDGRTTTLLMTEDVANTTLRQLAEGEGWKPDSTQHPDPEKFPPRKGRAKYETYLDFLNEKGLKVQVEQTVTIGDVHVKMVPGYEGAHGPAQAGVAVIRKGEALYWDPSDGDFDLASINKQIQKWKGLDREISQLHAKQDLTPDDKKKLADLEAMKPHKKERLEELSRTRKYLLEADVIDVDQGTSGFDTHGTDKTVRNLRRERLEKPQYPNLSEAKREKVLDMAEQGKWDEIKSFLIDEGWKGERVRTAVEIELKGVRPTHNLGYGSRFALPQVREGRTLEMERDGRGIVRYPKLEAEFQAAGLTMIPDSKVNSRPKDSVAEVEFEGARYFIDRSNEQTFTHGIKQIVEKYSATDVAFTANGKVETAYFDLKSMLIEGQSVMDVPAWTKESITFTANTPPAPTNENAFVYLEKKGKQVEDEIFEAAKMISDIFDGLGL